MILFEIFLNLKFIIIFNLNFIFISTFFIFIPFFFIIYKSSNNFILQNSYIIYSKLYLLLTISISFFLLCFSFWQYLIYILYFESSFFFKNLGIIPLINIRSFFFYNLSFDFFGYIILFLAYIVGYIALLALDTRLYWKNIKYFLSFHLFILIVYLFVTISNIFLFFILYECLLVPSFLFVYYVSYSRRAIQASLYFVIWTQLGSFLVLLGVLYIISTTTLYDFNSLKMYSFTTKESYFLFFLFFFGFGFKVPIWPFHYWLTKTHVEAPSGFSIYLSGFLVKSALLGFYKFTNILGIEIVTTFFSTIAILGVIDASLKMWGQTDIKKLVAYGTIQEMNLIYITFCWGDTNAILVGIIFSATHAFLSALMFFLVDCVYRRFHTRFIPALSGILHLTPNLGICILIMCIFFAGIPGTLKFVSEFYLFTGLFEISTFSTFFLMFISNVIGLIGFSKCWFNIVFGLNSSLKKTPVLDLTIKEFYIIFLSFFFLFFFTFISHILF